MLTQAMTCVSLWIFWAGFLKLTERFVTLFVSWLPIHLTLTPAQDTVATMSFVQLISTRRFALTNLSRSFVMPMQTLNSWRSTRPWWTLSTLTCQPSPWFSQRCCLHWRCQSLERRQCRLSSWHSGQNHQTQNTNPSSHCRKKFGHILSLKQKTSSNCQNYQRIKLERSTQNLGYMGEPSWTSVDKLKKALEEAHAK